MEELVEKVLLNRYRVDQLIGRGGMTDVYKVWDTQRAVFLAMKVLREDLAFLQASQGKRRLECVAHFKRTCISL